MELVIKERDRDGIKLFYIPLSDRDYLHSDGIVRDGTINEDIDECTGYYTSSVHAELVKDLFEKRTKFEEFLEPETTKEENEQD